MSAFRFAEPGWVHALWAVLAFALLLLWLDRRGGGALDRLIGSALQQRLVQRPTLFRRRMRIGFLALSGACLVLALMRPQLGIRHVATPRIGAEIMVALDVSNSMLAEDVAPNRLERAKAEIVDLLAYLDGNQVGLIAFAGRASVLSPLTPDFSFLRLVLDGAGPHSVTRGGTRLEEPIRKAVQGFGAAGESSRVILLITDGGDHGSFPRDAAEAAAEAGIVIIPIGLGGEQGSDIYITDKQTGARELLRDAEGRPVRSGLDGELLRDLALATQGAYVPAGTGVLDLESIYRQHIEPLMLGQLDPRGRTVRDEGYQWAVLLALILLVSSVAISGTAARVWVGVLLLTLSNASAPPARAQLPADASPDPEPVATEGAEAGAAPEATPEPEDPRELYNLGVTDLDGGDFDAALRRFDRARREAGSDAKLRFHAAYNLGIASASRADALEADSPEEALRALYTAADWFRDAIGQRPEDEDSRVNLDVALRRALLLADRIAQQDDKGVDAELAEIAERQRELVGTLAGLHVRVSEDAEAAAAERLKREFRARATAQRTLLSDADQLAREIDAEREGIASRPDEERTPEDQMRVAQLEGVLHYFHRARERMGQTRRQLRQKQSERAYRRGSAALEELKRALDQLRGPSEVLDALIRDVGRIAAATSALVLSERELPAAAEPIEIPVWLTRESLHADQRSAAERTEELGLRLRAGLEQGAGAEPQHQAMLDAVREAEPLVASAAASLNAAATELESGSPEAALSPQREGLAALADARERFLDLRGLIEAIYADERRLAELLGAEGAGAEAARKEYLPALRELQTLNLARAERLDSKLEAEANAPSALPPGPDGGPPDAEAQEIQQQRLELASQLLTLASAQMDAVDRALGDSGTTRWSTAHEASRAAVDHLEALRRLFFTILEELREVAQQQLDLADATQDAAALADPASEEGLARVGPLAPRQTELASQAGVIANALAEQSDQAGGVAAAETDSAETSRRLRQAGEHVLLAQIEMEAAAEWLGEDPPQLEPTPARQLAALAELEQALALLVPPEQREPPEDQQSDESSDSSESGQGEAQPRESQAPSEPVDPAQLLQAVRDREAQRRHEREQRGSAGQDTVEKDW